MFKISALNLCLNHPKKDAFSNSTLSLCYTDLQHHHTPKLDGTSNPTAHKWKNKNKQTKNPKHSHLKNRPEGDISSVSQAQNYLLPSLSHLFQISKRSLILGQCYDNGSMPT